MSLELWHFPLLALAGLVAGWINVLAGGGSLLTIPIMLFLGIPGPVANGTNRIGVVLQSISACSTFFYRGYPDWRLGLSLALATLPGAAAGAVLGTRLAGENFDRLLALTMVVVMLLMLRPPAARSPQQVQLSRGRQVVGHLAMLGIGFWGGLIQVGVGFLLMPALNRILGIDLVRVNQHKVFIVLVYTLVATVIFMHSGQVLWLVGLSLALGNFLGGWLGAHMTLTRGEPLIRRVFLVVILLFILKLMF